MLYVPNAPDFRWNFSSVEATRPAAAMGTSVTPGNNTKGSWAEVISDASVTTDVFGILINVNSIGSAAAQRDTILDVGTDPAGGTSYSTVIPNLLVSCATPYNVLLGGVWYYFPLFIKAGSAIAVRSSQNNGSPAAHRCFIHVFGKPRNQDAVKVGQKVTAYGINTGTSSGTAVTSGTTSEGAWTSLGTTAEENWWWQMGMGVNDGSMTALMYHADLGIGDASNTYTVIEGVPVLTDATERLSLINHPGDIGGYHNKSGDIVYGRLQCSGTPDASLSLAAYGLR